MAVVVIEARSDPMPGSVIAIAVISSPDAMPGSQRARCSSVQYRMKYGRQMSLCRVMPSMAPPVPARSTSSTITVLNRKSVTPPPPSSSGTSKARNPCRPASANTSRGTMPASSHSVVVGDDLLLEPAAEAGPQLLVLGLEEIPAHG